MGCSFNDFVDVVFLDVAQRSLLGSILFNKNL